MTGGDVTAERQVAVPPSQNTPERKKLGFAPVAGFCNWCEREITKRDPVWIVGNDLACSQVCSDELVEQWRRDAAGVRVRSRMPAEPFADIVPHQASSQTSRDSAAKNASTMRSKMQRIHNRIKEAGPYGVTRQELVDLLDISLQTICGRVRRLYQMGLIGVNCREGCKEKCNHPPISRPNRISGFDNEVLVDELWVDRWTPEQQRPAERPSWERAR